MNLRALYTEDEEMKHQQLFRRTETVLEESCGHPFGRYFDDDKVRVTEFTNAVLAYLPLSRFLLSLSAIIAGVALTDPSFAKVALELSKEGAAKLGIT